MQLDTVCNRFERRVIDLYAAEPDLHTLPREVFECVGKGAGGAPTAEAIAGDLNRILAGAAC